MSQKKNTEKNKAFSSQATITSLLLMKSSGSKRTHSPVSDGVCEEGPATKIQKASDTSDSEISSFLAGAGSPDSLTLMASVESEVSSDKPEINSSLDAGEFHTSISLNRLINHFPSQPLSHSSVVSPPVLAQPMNDTEESEFEEQSEATGDESCDEPSSMLHFMLSDKNAPSVICEFIGAREVAIMYQTCRTWRDWIIDNSRHLKLGMDIGFATFPLLATCDWAVAATIAINLTYFKGSSVGSFRTAFLMLPRMRRLESLGISWGHDGAGPVSSEVEIPTVLQKLPQLTSLKLVGRTYFLNMFLKHVHVASIIRQVIIHQLLLGAQGVLEFKQMKLLKRLKTFRLTSESIKSRARVNSRAPQLRCVQAYNLLQCESLKNLQMGTWDHLLSPVPFVDFDRHEKGGIQRRLNADVLVALVTRASGDPSNALLRTIDFQTTEFTRSTWETVSKLQLLTQLQPLTWKGLDEDAWLKLSAFTQLRKLSLRVQSDFPFHLFADHIAPNLKHINWLLIQNTSHSGLLVSSDDMKKVCSKRSLENLRLRNLRFDFSALKYSARRLATIDISNCAALDGTPIDSFQQIPSLRYARKLRISPFPVGGEQAKEAFKQRCPCMEVVLVSNSPPHPLAPVLLSAAAAASTPPSASTAAASNLAVASAIPAPDLENATS